MDLTPNAAGWTAENTMDEPLVDACTVVPAEDDTVTSVRHISNMDWDAETESIA